ncbi:hypothetical protein ISN45_Aa05g006000 [Arabidopsis thaliana x Arabidopsis arenosa]|uniref:Uncharacterized protein n=1 Tax=Arabidopsis thaliana x Arabidopsis arenosa TaxID=1240361 RepID=A0A8T1ZJU3_9BRAS|nr:hypothetical protein ISN45_Aa05g006000 [Arabidopsis thaliana x Arabidopsis arenosa]
MDSPIPPTASAIAGDEDWELYNDEGFVYKRKKRSRIADAEETSKPPDPELDPVLEERNRWIRKKRILLKLKRKYQSEIEQWEILSNSLNSMQEKADRFQTTQREESLNTKETISFPENTSSTIDGARESGGEDASAPSSMLDQLLFMAEAQEAVINDVSKLCEVAENICRIEEEENKQCFFDLPIWSSPKDLMTSLCAD